MKKIGFLLDTSNKVGSGHFWRCLNLACQIKKKINKAEIYFISNNKNIFLFKILKKKNIKFLNLNKIQNLNEIKKKLLKYRIKFLITDIYNLSSEKKKILKNLLNKLIVIDDFDNKFHNSDIYINNNYLLNSSIRKIKNKNKNTLLLLGQKYQILNEKINFFREKSILRNEIKKILVFFGSYDPTNETLKLMSKVSKLKNVKFYIVLSKINKNYIKNKTLLNKIRHIKLIINPTNENFLKIVNECDISIGAGGVSLLERLALGLPSIVIKIADNQQNSINYLYKKKLIYYLGDKNNVNYEKLTKLIDDLKKNKKKFREFSLKTFSFFKNKDLYLLSKKLSLIINQSNV